MRAVSTNSMYVIIKQNKKERKCFKAAAFGTLPPLKAEFYTDYDASVIYMDGYPSHEQLLSGIREEIYGAITMELTNKDVVYVTPEKPYNKYTKIVFKEL